MYGVQTVQSRSRKIIISWGQNYPPRNYYFVFESAIVILFCILKFSRVLDPRFAKKHRTTSEQRDGAQPLASSRRAVGKSARRHGACCTSGLPRHFGAPHYVKGGNRKHTHTQLPSKIILTVCNFPSWHAGNSCRAPRASSHSKHATGQPCMHSLFRVTCSFGSQP